MFAAWVVGLGAVVGLAVIGSGTVDERSIEANRSTASVAVADQPASARSISLDLPARRDVLVNTSEILVRGQAGTEVARVRVTLESRGGKLLASQWIDRSATTGAETFPFEARFEATTARPAGVMWVTATALGADGIPIDAMRRRFQLGKIEDAPATATREVVVRGRVAESLGDVRIVLEWADGSRLASTPVDPTGHGHGDWVPFEARFRLRTPPPGGAWPSFIVAVDRAGEPIDATKYPFTVRSYVHVPASSGPALAFPAPPVDRHTTGEDGLMGGIPFGTNMLEGA